MRAFDVLLAKAAPRPWVHAPQSTAVRAQGCIVADCCLSTPDVDTANAALIVRAVNAHDDLVAACERALAALGRCSPAANDRRGASLHDIATADIRAALAKAGVE